MRLILERQQFTVTVKVLETIFQLRDYVTLLYRTGTD